MAKFLTELDLCPHPSTDALWVVQSQLLYACDLTETIIRVPVGFVTDLASIPLGIKWCHREGVLHDYLYRIDAYYPKDTADRIFLEAMQSRKKSVFTQIVFYLAVKWFGGKSYHKKTIDWKI